MNVSNFKEFTNLRPVTKVAQFELVPMKETAENLEKSEILTTDITRNENIDVIKGLIDDVHVSYVNEVLCYETNYIDFEPLAEALLNFKAESTPETRNALKTAQENYRKAVVAFLTSNESYKKLRGQELFKVLIPAEIAKKPEEEREHLYSCLESMQGFTSFFTDYYDLRENLYSSNNKSGTIAVRAINENFGKFLNNIEAYQDLKSYFSEELNEQYALLQKHIPRLEKFTLDEVFTLDAYNAFLPQQGIEAFNRMLNGIKLDEFNNVKGLIQLVYELIAKNPDVRVKKFEPLYKQMLVVDDSLKFKRQAVSSDEECIAVIEQLWDEFEESNFLEEVKNLFASAAHMDKSKIYIKNRRLTDVSLVLFGDWGKINEVLTKFKEKSYKDPKKAKAQKEIKAWLNQDFSIADIEAAFEDMETAFDMSKYYAQVDEYVKSIREAYASYANAVAAVTNGKYGLKEGSELVGKIKAFVEASLSIQGLMTTFDVSDDYEKAGFYEKFNPLFEEARNAVTLNHKVKAYITKKPQEQKKIPLTFNMANLGGGWSKNKVRENGTLLMRKDDDYYIGVLNKGNMPKIDHILADATKDTEGKYATYFMQVAQSAVKFVPKVTVATKEVKEHFATGTAESYIFEAGDKFVERLEVTREIYDMYIQKPYAADFLKNGGDEAVYTAALKKWMDFHNEVLSKHSSSCMYHLPKKNDYKNMHDYDVDVTKCLYAVEILGLEETVVDDLVKNGQLFLFKITSRALQQKRLNKILTLYFLAFFTPENMQSLDIQLRGNACIYFRKASIEKPKVHKAGELLISRRTKDGEIIPAAIYGELNAFLNKKTKNPLSDEAEKYLNKLQTRKATHDIIKDRRYTVDKFLGSFTLILNAKHTHDSDKLDDFNQRINEYIREHDMKVLAIARGENSLINAVLMDRDGKVLMQKKYDVVITEHCKTNYRELIKTKKEDALKNQKEWLRIDALNDVKDGFLSQIVTEVARLAIDENAIIICDDTKYMAKRNPFQLENEIYKNFIKALQGKLNFCVPEKSFEGVRKAWQLTLEAQDKYITTQNGILFFVPGSLCNKMDISTGFTNLFNLREVGKNTQSIRAFFEKFESIEYSEAEDAFYFKFDYRKFETYVPSNQIWEIATGQRRLYDKATKSVLPYNLTKDMKVLMVNNTIEYVNGDDILPKIMELEGTMANAKFYQELYNIFAKTLQVRNKAAVENCSDILVSPIRTGGTFFTTGPDTILNADIAIAYCMAVKGLDYIEQIKSGEKKAVRMEKEEWLYNFREFVKTHELAH